MLILRILLVPVVLVLLLTAPPAPISAYQEEPIPKTGTANPAAGPFDGLMTDLLRRYDIPGGSLAVSREGNLLLARAYGYADRSSKTPARPESVFRIASVSKPVTAVAVLQLVENGRLRLDDRAFEILKLQSATDPRIKDITVRELLLHSAGWDRDTSFDPMFHFGLSKPERIIQQMLDRPLDFAPGSRHAYSNFGYCVLGRIIERVSGTTYEAFVRQQVLGPIKVHTMRIGGRGGDGPEEVHYYGDSAYNLLPDVMDSHGGWVASATDLVRFADGVWGRGTRAFLKPETLAAMVARPAPPLWVGTRNWYGLGWNVVPAQSGVNCAHGGAMPGTTSLLVCTYNGYTWAAVFNRMPPVRGAFMSELDRGLWEASRSAWPSATP